MVNWLKRRVLPLILAVAMLASYLPVSAFAEGDDPTVWEIQAGTLISYSQVKGEFPEATSKLWKIVDGSNTDVYVPFELDSSSIKSISLSDIVSALWTGDWSKIQQKLANATGWEPEADESKQYYVLPGSLNRSFQLEWDNNNKVPFKFHFYSNVETTVTPAELSDNVTVTTNQAFQDAPGSITVQPVEGYDVTVTMGGNTISPNSDDNTVYSIPFDSTGTSTVNVSYTPKTYATVNVESSGADVMVNETAYTGEPVKVSPGSTVELTIIPADNMYLPASGVVVDGNALQSKDVQFNSDAKTYTATFTAGSADDEHQVKVTCEPVIPTDPLEIPYISGQTTADNVKDSIRNLLASSPVSSEIKIQVKQDILGYDTWWELSDRTLENLEKNTTLRLVYEGNSYPASTVEVSYTLVDPRVATSIKIANDNLMLSYDPSLTAEDVLNLLDVSVVASDGTIVADADVTIDNEFPLAAGTTKVNLTYAGDDTHGMSTAEANVTVNKADATVSVGFKTAKYGDTVDASSLITVDPAEAKHIDVAVGFGLNDEDESTAVAYVDLPIDLGLASGAVDDILNEINGTSVSVGKLNETLTELLKVIDGLQSWVDLGIDTSSINTLLNLLEQFQDMDFSVTVNVTLNKGITLTNSGAYLLASIVSDPNYNQSVGMGAVVIVPDAQYTKLAFKYPISNGIVTSNLVTSDYMAAYVDNQEVDPSINEKIGNIFFGVQENGDFYVEEEPSSTIGGYVQIAYLKDFGNEMLYALPIARAYAVVSDTAKIVFEGDTEVTYNGQYTAITAKVVDDNGDAIEDATPTLYFTGIQSDGKLYSKQEQPDNAGYYTVVATYANDDHTLVAAGATTLTINPAESSITVNDQVYTYDGNAVNVSGMIQASPKEANVAVMVASLSAANGELSNISGAVNIDMPAYVDEVLEKVIPDVYENGLNVETVKQEIANLKTSMKNAGLDGSFLDYVLEMVDQLPSNVNLTFKNGVTCSDVGVYLVAASVFDPNYQFNIDTGILVIAPEVTEADLAWNSEISGGVLTTPMLHDFDFDAQALVNGEKDPDISERIQYLYFGIDASGNVIKDTDPSKLTNGVYTEIAYILEDGTSIAVAKPIVRTFVVHAKDVDVDFLDENNTVSKGGLTVVYDGEPQEVTVQVSDNGTVIIPDEGTLTVSYTGVDSLGRFYSDTKAPTQTGYYTVFASYVERDADGELQRVGANITTLTIEPGDATFNLKDTTVYYDGTAKQITVENPQNLDYITVVVDKDKNVNVVFPASWNVPAESYDIDQGIDTILATLDKLSGNTNARSTTLLDNLRQILNSIQIKTLQFNGAYPVNIGTYEFSALAFSENYKPVTASATLTIQEKPVTPTEPSNPGDSGNSGNTQTVTSSGSSSSNDNQTQSTPAPTATVTIPQTGDTMPVGLLIGLVVAAAVALAVLVVVRKRKRN